MLVLTRKQNEQIRIGDHITITVVRAKGNAVRLGIQAPGDVAILRGELVFDLEAAEENSSADEAPSVGTAEQPLPRASGDASPRRRQGSWPSRAAKALHAAGPSSNNSQATPAARPLQVGFNSRRDRSGRLSAGR